MAPNKKGKAGGTGKKGKKFVEDKVSRDLTMSYSTGGQDSNLSVASLTGYKSALLSLMDNIPKIQKETAREEAAIAVTLSAKGKSSSLAGDDEEIAVTSNHSDSEGLENREGDPVKRDTPRIVKEQGKKESKNRQRTKIKNRALLDTKRSILAQTKEAKKQRRHAKKPGSTAMASPGNDGLALEGKPKRRVGFAV